MRKKDAIEAILRLDPCPPAQLWLSQQPKKDSLARLWRKLTRTQPGWAGWLVAALDLVPCGTCCSDMLEGRLPVVCQNTRVPTFAEVVDALARRDAE